MTKQLPIVLKNVRVHNLKGVDLTLSPHQLIVFTGVSGCGKSSLAFDTIYIEGQRRYIESLSTYARRHMGDLSKPDAESISGISPTIAIEQKSVGKNPRSTVGTLTGLYDYLRVLFAKIAIPYCPISHEPVISRTQEEIIKAILSLPQKTKAILLAPFVKGKKGSLKDELDELRKKGFMRVRLDQTIIDLSEEINVNESSSHDLDIVIDRFVLSKENFLRVTEGIIQGLELGKGVVIVLNAETNEETLFSKFAYSKKSNLSYSTLEPQDFSFNHPQGMCLSCEGLGSSQEFDLEQIIDQEKSISEDCCSIAGSYQTVKWGNIYDNLAELYDFEVKTPWKKLSEKAKKVFLYGAGEKWIRMKFIHPVKKNFWYDFVKWKGVIHEAKRRMQEASSDAYKESISKLMKQDVCSECHGSKLKPYPSAARLGGKKIHEITEMSVKNALEFFNHFELVDSEKVIGEDLVQEIKKRLKFLFEVGLDYLSISRQSPTLSGGEAQRVRLASQIGSGLVGATYVLDEPSIGLHPRDNTKLIQSLKRLRDLGNTVIVVEHDEEMILSADTVVDIGPNAGSLGGELLVCGSVYDLLKSKRSLTGAYLSGKEVIETPKKRREISSKKIKICKASHHNLKGIDVEIPLEVFVSVTGISGSGKSSLITDILHPALANCLHKAEQVVGKHQKIEGIEHLNKVICIDQTPIGRTPRSNPATYVKVFDEIRDLFSRLKESQSLGYTPGHFSFNVSEGSCTNCKGMGYNKIDMDFMDDTWVICPVCQGERFDKKVLNVKFKEKSIYDVLEMTIEEAYDFFSSIPSIFHSLEVLKQVGLGYIKLGQSSTTLSGGEAQRIKLAKELIRPSTGKTLYILDEPTTGLHYHDVKKLIELLQKLVDQKNTVLVIEHHMDFVKTSDWILDLGPEGGEKGGRLVAEGTPEQIAQINSPTGQALYEVLNRKIHLEEIKKKTKPPVIQKLPIVIEGASQNNLKNLSLEIPQGKITVCTGPSGCGKSSLAFETLYSEGQRRYVESLSSYARQFVKQMPKAKVEKIEGLSPSIAIEQKHHAGNPRSTIGTMTEVYDYLRVLYARAATPFCPETLEPIKTITKEFAAKKLLTLEKGSRLVFLSPYKISKSIEFEATKQKLQEMGFLRIRLNGKYFELDEEIEFDKNLKNTLEIVIDRIILKEGGEKRIYEAVDKASSMSSGIFLVNYQEKDLLFNLSFAVESTGKSYPAITPHTFSFNSEEGMCLECLGLGFQFGASLFENPQIPEMSPLELISELTKEKLSRASYKMFCSILKKEGIDPEAPIKDLEKAKLDIFLHGSNSFTPHEGLMLSWIGIYPMLSLSGKCAQNFAKKTLQPLLKEAVCPECEGTRLNALARHAKIEGISLPDLCRMSIDKAAKFLKQVSLSKENEEVLKETLEQIKLRLSFLNKIGLEYLSLERSAPTLSGGETQRIFLARQLGSGLCGTLYVLDEPTIGLHPYNNELLNSSLKELRDLGNTLVLVEHDPLTIEIADHIIDFGPCGGKDGGYITAEGTLSQIKKNPNSLTGKYLSNKLSIALPKKRRSSEKSLEILDASLHNLKNINTKIQSGCITCITGVSGSGKSTLLHGIIKEQLQSYFNRSPEKPKNLRNYELFDKCLSIDQNPIGHTNRADVSTYVDLLTPLRGFFAKLPQAAMRGLLPAHFSYNHKKGMCKTCEGLGYKTISLQFLPSVKVDCPACHGHRLNPVSLEVKYKEKNLGELLSLTLAEARSFLPPMTKVIKILDVLESVGLSYLTLGQEIATLSGGEAQRLRLSKELIKRSTGKTLYLLDEPTIGLHPDDVLKLVKIFQKLASLGNTLVIVEHNLDIIAQADEIIDIGPFAAEAGGKVVAKCTPEELIHQKESITGRFLKEYLYRQLK
jgi:excinuclease ABC subunit A